MTTSAFKKASSFTVKFLPSFGKKKEIDSEFSSGPSTGDIPEEEPPVMESSQTSFSRAQSIPVTRSEHASVPSHQEIHSSLRSILRPSRLVQKIDEEQSPASFDISNFSKVLETTSDSDDEDTFGRLSSSGRKKGSFSPPPFARARTAPGVLQSAGARTRSYLPVNETKPSSGLSRDMISKIPADDKKLDKYLKDSAKSAGVPVKPPVKSV